MFTPTELHLLAAGHDDAVHRFIEAPHALVVDWKAGEEDVLGTVELFLPPGTLAYRVEPAGEGHVRVGVSYAGREGAVILPERRAVNAFHVLLLLADVLAPDHEVRVFRATAGDDTPCFLVRPAAWWDALRTGHAKVFEEVFDDLAGFRAATGPVVFPPPDAALVAPVPTARKPWWKRG